MAKHWFLLDAKSNDEVGPFTDEQLIELASDGQLTPHSAVRAENEQHSRPASFVPCLREISAELKADTPHRWDVEVAYAGFGPRLVAYIIDGIVGGLLLGGLALLIGVAAGSIGQASSNGSEINGFLGFLDQMSYAWFMGSLMVFQTMYFTLFHAGKRGATPGKRLAGIRVVTANMQRLTFWQSFARYAALMLPAMVISWMPMIFVGFDSAAGFGFAESLAFSTLAFSSSSAIASNLYNLLNICMVGYTKQRTAVHDLIVNSRVICA